MAAIRVPGSAEWDAFLVAHFEAMRQEINLRITNYTNLVGAKVVTSGALVGFLLTQTDDAELRLLGLLLAPVIGLLYDVLVAKNIKAIHSVGIYIRDHIEPWYEGTFWEGFAGQRKRENSWGLQPAVARLGRNYGMPDIFMLAAFDAGLMLIALWQTWKNDLTDWVLPGLGVLYVAMLAVAVFLMWRNILFEIPPQSPEA